LGRDASQPSACAVATMRYLRGPSSAWVAAHARDRQCRPMTHSARATSRLAIGAWCGRDFGCSDASGAHWDVDVLGRLFARRPRCRGRDAQARPATAFRPAGVIRMHVNFDHRRRAAMLSVSAFAKPLSNSGRSITLLNPYAVLSASVRPFWLCARSYSASH
jgi:hypothetical protein